MSASFIKGSLFVIEFILIFIHQLLKKDDDGNYNKAAITACKQIVDCLVENVLRIEENSAGKELFTITALCNLIIWSLYFSHINKNVFIFMKQIFLTSAGCHGEVD